MNKHIVQLPNPDGSLLLRLNHRIESVVAPDEMIRGPVVDPRLTLENPDIARRHLRAYLLQRYHEARIPGVDPAGNPNLFSVLGPVRESVSAPAS